MSSHNKRESVDVPGGEEKARRAKERRTEIVVGKIETQLCACFTKLHSTRVILGQAKANLEMIGGLICRQKDEHKQALLRLQAARRGPSNEVKLTVVGEAAYQKFQLAMHDQIQELGLVEAAIANAHTALAEDNEKRNGPWLPVPPIRARPECKSRSAQSS